MSQTAQVARTRQSGWPLALALWAGVGCAANHSMPQDPLFIAHKPVEAKAEAGPPIAVAFSEPTMPLDPATALARAKQDKTVPGILTVNPKQDAPLPRPLPTIQSFPTVP